MNPIAARRMDPTSGTRRPLRAGLLAALARISARIETWRRRSRDRAALSRMDIRQLDDLPIEWPEDFRHIRRS